jgi:hypothetical protein
MEFPGEIVKVEFEESAQDCGRQPWGHVSGGWESEVCMVFHGKIFKGFKIKFLE